MFDHPILEVPEWVPAEVAAAARMILGNGEAPLDIVKVTQRLLSNVQMKKVWVELKRNRRDKYRPSGESFHSIQLPPEIDSQDALVQRWKAEAEENRSLGDEPLAKQFEFLSMAGQVIENNSPAPPIPDDMRHGLALALFFSLAVALYAARERSITQKEAERWENVARNRGLTEQAGAVRRFLAKPEVSRQLVKRQRVDPRLRAYIVNLAFQTRQIFGSPLARTIATTANVAFAETGSPAITPATVKALLRKIP